MPPSPATVPLGSYEEGVQAGVSAMRESVLEVLQLCSLAGGDARKVLMSTVSFLQAGAGPDEVRAELATETILNMPGGDADLPPDWV